MKCGWSCGAQLTGRNMRAHFTICPKRPAVSEDGDRRGRRVELETAKGLNFATRQARRNLFFDDARTSRQPSGPFQNGSLLCAASGPGFTASETQSAAHRTASSKSWRAWSSLG